MEVEFDNWAEIIGSTPQYRKKNIVRLEADGNATILYLSNGVQIRRGYNIKNVIAQLGNPSFIIKIHKSHAVNIYHVIYWKLKGKNAYLILKDKSQVPISRLNREEIKRQRDLFL